MRTLRVAATAAAVSLAPFALAAQTFTIGTTSVGTNLVGAGRVAGDPTTFQTLAQSFVVPTACPATCYLQSFGFFLGDGFGGASTRLRAYVYHFSPAGFISGPALFRSAELAGSGNFVGLDAYTVGTSNLALLRSGAYAFVLSVSEPFAAIPEGRATLASATLTSEYADGALWGATNGGDLSALDEPGALRLVVGAPDLSFRATFTATVIPEPGTVTLVAAGLVGVLGAGWRRRRATTG